VNELTLTALATWTLNKCFNVKSKEVDKQKPHPWSDSQSSRPNVRFYRLNFKMFATFE